MAKKKGNEFFDFFGIRRRLFYFTALAGEEMERFHDREYLLELFKTAVLSGDICAIVGKQGTGKSSFLLMLKEMLSDSRYCDYIHFSLPVNEFEKSRLKFLKEVLRSMLDTVAENCELLDAFDSNEIEREIERLQYSTIYEEQTKTLKTVDGKVEAGVKSKLLKTLIPVEAKAELSGKMEKENIRTKKDDFPIHTDDTLIQSITRISQRLKEPLVLFIDELDKVGRYPLESPVWDKEVIKILDLSRELMGNKNLIMVFSLQDELYEKLSKADQGEGDDSIFGLINFFEPLHGFDLDFAKEAVKKSLDVVGYQHSMNKLLENGVIEIVLNVVDGNPRRFMKFLHELSMHAYLKKQETITLELVKHFFFDIKKFKKITENRWKKLLALVPKDKKEIKPPHNTGIQNT